MATYYSNDFRAGLKIMLDGKFASSEGHLIIP